MLSVLWESLFVGAAVLFITTIFWMRIPDERPDVWLPLIFFEINLWGVWILNAIHKKGGVKNNAHRSRSDEKAMQDPE